jgi:putative hydrolase
VIALKLEADLHTHTIASDGYSTVREMAEYAGQKGLKIIAITDHGLGMDGGPHINHFLNMGMWPRVMSNVKVLRGVEANILDSTGTVDMPEMLLKELDIVLAGFHEEAGYAGSSVEENTRAMIGAIGNPFVHIIVHPGNPQFPVDPEQIVAAAKHYGKALELNNKSFDFRPGSSPNCNLIAKLAHRHKLTVAINSDAHLCYGIGECATAIALAEETGIDERYILNTSAESVVKFLAQHSTRQLAG